MLRKKLLSLALPLSFLTVACHNSTPAREEAKQDTTVQEKQPMDTLRLALDWTPNVLHSGIFLAQARGWYKDENLYVDWFTPEVDNYTKKPLKRVLDGEADLSIGPSEHLFFYALDSSGHTKAAAVASLLQKDMSAFVSRKGSGIINPGYLEGKTYLGYHTPMEEEVLSGMIEHYGGKGEFEIRHPARLDVWDAFMQGEGDVAWVFVHWESMLAQQEGVELNEFIPNAHGVPYGYSSVVMAPVDMSAKQKRMLKKFLKASRKGYAAITENPAEVVSELMSFIDHPNFKNADFITAAQQRIAPAYFNDDGRWGGMEASRWEAFWQWVNVHGLVKTKEEVKVEQFFTDEFIEELAQ